MTDGLHPQMGGGRSGWGRPAHGARRRGCLVRGSWRLWRPGADPGRRPGVELVISGRRAHHGGSSHDANDFSDGCVEQDVIVLHCN